MRALLAMPAGLQHRMFDTAQLTRLRDLVEVDTEHTLQRFTQAAAGELEDVEVLITGWGSPPVDADALHRMPNLRAVVHTAGTVRFVITEAVWARGDIVVTSSTEANAVPVAEFTLAQILLAGKHTLQQQATHHRSRAVTGPVADMAVGNYGAVVGLVGASRIGRLVAEHLQRFDLEVLIADPYVSAAEIQQLGATKVELPELFSRSSIVSLHAPDVPSTQGMVGAELLALMPDGATFLNTARPALVDLDALRRECVSGRIAAVLDVHDDLSPDDPLWDVPTVSITPHIAGSQGNETRRMGEQALQEVSRLVTGTPPQYPVDFTRLDITA